MRFIALVALFATLGAGCAKSGDGGARCADGCEATLAARCNAGPPDQAVCEEDCNALRSGSCGVEYTALLDCAQAETIVCSAEGIPEIPACSPQQMAFVACLNGGSVIGTCDTRAKGDPEFSGMCRTWAGQETGDFQGLCEAEGGDFGSVPCGSSSLVGSCFTDQGFGLFLTYDYYSPTFDTNSAEAHCTSLPSCSFSCEFRIP